MTRLTDQDRIARTRLLARIVGPFLLVAGAAVALRANTIDTLFPAFFQDTPLVLITGVFTLMVGLVMVAAHHHWNSLAASVISVLAIVAVIRGVTLMLAPDLAAALAEGVTHAPAVPLALAALIAIVGAWLTFIGWLQKAESAS
ncbi:MAG: hypothetical protein HXY28_10510 [Hydrogenophilaceae bacterium]|jgi:uncharacterized protein YjeT (DUF2065 family)|nr:hypothetical protein [Hydrogenophilaceae bacterium]